MKEEKSLHTKLIEYAMSLGWQKNDFKKSIKKKLLQRPWTESFGCDECISSDSELLECEDYQPGRATCVHNENLECFEDLRVIPDCWRVKIEDQNTPNVLWSHPVLIIECLEVVVANDLSEQKMEEYNTYWWRADASMKIFFRLYKMDRFGHISLVILPNDIYGIPTSEQEMKDAEEIAFKGLV